jgi:hypothetical protein
MEKCVFFGVCTEFLNIIQTNFGFKRFSMVFLRLRGNTEFVPKFHVALHAYHAALPILISKLCPKVAPPI